jgi:hypothetical protein
MYSTYLRFVAFEYLPSVFDVFFAGKMSIFPYNPLYMVYPEYILKCNLFRTKTLPLAKGGVLIEGV